MTARGQRKRADDQSSKALWPDRAKLLRVMAHEMRLMILDALADHSQCVKELNSLVPIPQVYLSQHMAALRKAKLVDRHSMGTMRCYYLLRPALVKRLIRLLREDHPVHFRDKESVAREAKRGAKAKKLHPAATKKKSKA